MTLFTDKLQSDATLWQAIFPLFYDKDARPNEPERLDDFISRLRAMDALSITGYSLKDRFTDLLPEIRDSEWWDAQREEILDRTLYTFGRMKGFILNPLPYRDIMSEHDIFQYGQAAFWPDMSPTDFSSYRYFKNLFKFAQLSSTYLIFDNPTLGFMLSLMRYQEELIIEDNTAAMLPTFYLIEGGKLYMK